MKLLLDTQLRLWAAGQPKRLSAPARKRLKIGAARSDSVLNGVL